MPLMNDSFAVVTGGAGFVGSHLCDALVTRGEKVLCLDNLFTGSKKNIEHLLRSDQFHFIECNINHLPDATKQSSLHQWKIHAVYNLACPASPVHYQHDPVETVRTNVVGTINMLDFAREKNAVFLQASTSEVYGDPEVHPQPETYVGHVNPLGPRACYDEGKRCAETLCSDYHREYGLTTKIARIFNTYGPRMALNDGRVVSNFIIQALKNDPITIYGSGSHTRSFQYVDDLIRGLLALADHPSFHGPVNIGTQFEMTVKELAELIISLTGSKSTIVYKPSPEDDPKQRRPDTALAKEKLDWVPKVSVEEGLRKAVEYFRSVIQ
ncbi:MAG TPA: UDP-glucuronic acid decarboxylase family protein [Candidatus Peribacterales bacterium]|nr:UDP-glucuronic acid decarboxylase family protein [Candidatus Peribacterales bacterium]